MSNEDAMPELFRSDVRSLQSQEALAGPVGAAPQQFGGPGQLQLQEGLNNLWGHNYLSLQKVNAAPGCTRARGAATRSGHRPQCRTGACPSRRRSCAAPRTTQAAARPAAAGAAGRAFCCPPVVAAPAVMHDRPLLSPDGFALHLDTG